MDVLLAHGARLDLSRDDALDSSLANHAPRAAEKMIELGVRPDLLAAAALGRLDWLKGFFDADGRLTSRPRRHGREIADRHAIGLAALYAYVRDQKEAVDYLLEKHGNWDVTGVNNGTLLHRAASAGDLAMVQRLVGLGADVNNRDNPYGGTPLDWAWHARQSDVVRWLADHARVDAHTAVEFQLQDQLLARLREDASAASRCVDDGTVPNGTPLHAAARLDRLEAAAALLDHGSDPNALAGNGLSPLDVADAHGSASVAALIEQRRGRRTVATGRPRAQPKLVPFERLTEAIVEAYRTGTPEALDAVRTAFDDNISWQRLRANLQRELDKPSEGDVSLPEIRDLYARTRGFKDWLAFAASVTHPADQSTPGARATTWAPPLYRIDAEHNVLEVRHGLEPREWDAIIAAMADRRITGLNARGQMTDVVLERISQLGFVVRLDLQGSKRLTDAGMKHLARLPRLEHLSAGQTGVSDDGFAVLRELPNLRELYLHWHGSVTDAGMAHLAGSNRLEVVSLMNTPTGDGALKALAGKSHLRQLFVGHDVTEAGLDILQEFPAFKTWPGGEIKYGLMDFQAGPTYVQLNISRTSRRTLERLAGLNGLFAVNADNPVWKGVDIEPLARLDNLGWLGHDADDESMRQIGALSGLRMLMAQDTEAGDDGFAALSRSSSIEYIWGRRCYNLRGRGFAALSTMPSLRGLSVSCKNVDDEALAMLPRFPALTQFMPMDIADDGFRHVARCERIESLWLMYSRDTTDVATAHLAALPRLKHYYAGNTKMTDRSLEILGRMGTLETLQFWGCSGITNAGVARLAALPRLREIVLDECTRVSAEAVSLFPAHVRVRVSV